MAVKTRFEPNFNKGARTKNIFQQPKDMVLHDVLDGERKEKIKKWLTFFRRNPHRFCELYFGIKLHPYQVLWLWILQRSNLGYIVAARGTAKTFIIAVWALTLAVLYPGIKVITASKTMKQGGRVLEKIVELREKYPNIAREIKNIKMDNNGYECIFHCGSSIKAVPSSDNSRGSRANYLIIEESRLVSKEILDSVLKPFLEVRTPPYRLLSEYKKDPLLLEEGIMSFITSAGYKSEYWYQHVKSCIRRVISGDETANFLAFDYLTCLYHNIKTEEMLKNEMADNDALTVQMEYLNIPSGTSGKSYYRQSYFPRTIKRAFYPQRAVNYNSKKNPYDIKREEGELRFISVDIATRSGKKNDLSVIIATRALPMDGLGYIRQVVYMETFKGMNTILQAKRIKEIYHDFGADFLVLDLQQAGIAVFNSLTQATLSEERGVTYPAMTVVDVEYDFIDDNLRKELQEKTLAIGATPVIFPILASQALNSQMASLLRSSLQKKLWQFLLPEAQAEDWLTKNNKEFTADINDSDTYAYFMNPYVQTGMLIGEAINLDMSLVGGLIKLTEKPGSYKDRYSTILYLNYILSFFDKNLLKETKNEDDWEILQQLVWFG